MYLGPSKNPWGEELRGKESRSLLLSIYLQEFRCQLNGTAGRWSLSLTHERSSVANSLLLPNTLLPFPCELFSWIGSHCRCHSHFPNGQRRQSPFYVLFDQLCKIDQNYLVLFYVFECFTLCMYCVCAWCPRKREYQLPWNWRYGCCEPACGHWELSSDPVLE